MIPSAARTLGGPRSHHVSADIRHACLRVPQGSVLGPLRILVSTLSTTFRTRNTTPNSKQTYPYTDVWEGKWTQESPIKTLRPTSRQQTISVENSRDLDARMLFCFVFYVCVRAFFFILSRCQRERTIMFQLTYIRAGNVNSPASLTTFSQEESRYELCAFKTTKQTLLKEGRNGLFLGRCTS